MAVVNWDYDKCDTCGKVYRTGDGGGWDPHADKDMCLDCMKAQGLDQCGFCRRILAKDKIDGTGRCPNCVPIIRS